MIEYRVQWTDDPPTDTDWMPCEAKIEEGGDPQRLAALETLLSPPVTNGVLTLDQGSRINFQYRLAAS